jgi:hypothetical protein
MSQSWKEKYQKEKILKERKEVNKKDCKKDKE